MASSDSQQPPPGVPPSLGLGLHSQSPPPASGSEQLAGDLRDLTLDEEKKAEDCGTERAEKEEEEEEEEGEEESRGGKPFYPQRPGAPNCSFYMKRGKCAFGRKCKFNHPPLDGNVVRVQQEDSSEAAQAAEDDDSKETREEKYPKKVGKLRCKYFDTTGGCKYGSACRYNHVEGKKEAGQVEYNFLGLPLRPGEKECIFYMRNGSCKFSNNCRYHHPNPDESEGGSDMQSGHFGGASSPSNVSSAPQIPVPLHPPQMNAANSFPFIHVPTYMTPMPAVHQPPLHLSPGWNGYQPPMDRSFAPEGGGKYIPVPSVQGPPKSSGGDNTIQAIEFPQRAGQRDCPYYMKSGDCKFKSACKFNHPRDRISSAFSLSPKGLPLRPGQTVCTHYRRYGICKFGPTCIYDHPMDQVPSHTMAQ